MAYEVPPLPYDYDALEPHIDEQTMALHHDKHHQAYVDKANDALAGTEFDGKPIEEVIANLGALPEDKRGAVRNNGGGHLNHSLFWESMSPNGGGAPDGELGERDRRARSAPSTPSRSSSRPPASARFGSGWAWLVLDGGDAEDHEHARTRTTRSPTARRRCSATTSGSTRTTSSTRTAARTTSRRGGTSSTGPRSPSATPPRRSPRTVPGGAVSAPPRAAFALAGAALFALVARREPRDAALRRRPRGVRLLERRPDARLRHATARARSVADRRSGSSRTASGAGRSSRAAWPWRWSALRAVRAGRRPRRGCSSARAVQGLAVGAASGAATAALVELAPAGAAGRARRSSRPLAQAGRQRGRPARRRRAGRQWAPRTARRRASSSGSSRPAPCSRACSRCRGCPAGTGGRVAAAAPDVPRRDPRRFARLALTAAAAWAVAGLYLSVVAVLRRVAARHVEPRARGRDHGDHAARVVRGAGRGPRQRPRPRATSRVGLALVVVGLDRAGRGVPAPTRWRSSSRRRCWAASATAMAFLGAQYATSTPIAPPDRRGEVTAAFFVCIYLGVAVSAGRRRASLAHYWRRWRRRLAVVRGA